MQVRNAIVAVTVAAFALTLSACTSTPDPSPTDGNSATPSATASGTPTPAPTSSPAPTGEVTIRPLQPGYDLANVSDTIRGGFPSFEGKTDEDIEVILNAACDAMDTSKTPEAGADAMQAYGIAVYDAAFTVSAAISLYCPEYVAFLGGDTGSANG